MAIQRVGIDQFIALSKTNPVLDVRSPGEFKHAHFPGAYSLPLFTDEERKIVGTAYKQEGREKAIKLGLDYFGLKMRRMVEEAENITGTLSTKIILVHCWRGGMRSEAIAWLLDLYGFKIYTLEGGYKKFRRYVLQTFDKPFKLRILSGFTGAGKTALLKELDQHNQKTIDLENIASHKGSAFGEISQTSQPSQEMFENILALKLNDHLPESIWVEDESRRIGSIVIPPGLWKQIQHSAVYFLDVPFEERLINIDNEYGNLEKEKLIEATLRIQKRLGGLETKMAINYLSENNSKESFRILLGYYDKCYLKALDGRYKINEDKNTIVCAKVGAKENIQSLLGLINNSDQDL